MFFLILISLRKGWRILSGKNVTPHQEVLKESKKLLLPTQATKLVGTFYLGACVQIAYLVVLVYQSYPVVTGRSNYYLALKIAAVITTICASIAITNKSSTKSKQTVWTYTTLLGVMLLLIEAEDLKMTAIYYEMFMLLSAVALYTSSTSERAKKVVKDFLVWTQIGSALLLLGLLGIAYDSKIQTFYSAEGYEEVKVKAAKYVWLVLIGLLVKIPVIPLHYWITKVHVEASTSFSIFLSGFLVKTASAVLFKILPLLTETHEFVLVWSLTLSVIFSTFMLFAEADLKRFVAIGTIQEMGYATLILVITKSNNSSVAGTSLILHSLISIIMFWFADQVYCRIGHRSLNSTGGLWYVSPRTTVIMFIMLTLVRGLPLMFRYNVEMHSFETLLSADPALATVIIVVLATISNLAVVYRVFKLFFGCPNKKLLPGELQLSAYIVPLVALMPLVYFPFL